MLREKLMNMEEYRLVAIYNAVMDETGYPENHVYRMEEFDEMFYEAPEGLHKVLCMAHFGGFNPTHDFWRYDGYANLESIPIWGINDELTKELMWEDKDVVETMVRLYE